MLPQLQASFLTVSSTFFEMSKLPLETVHPTVKVSIVRPLLLATPPKPVTPSVLKLLSLGPQFSSILNYNCCPNINFKRKTEAVQFG
jgi:hypothetical protein